MTRALSRACALAQAVFLALAVPSQAAAPKGIRPAGTQSAGRPAAGRVVPRLPAQSLGAVGAVAPVPAVSGQAPSALPVSAVKPSVEPAVEAQAADGTAPAAQPASKGQRGRKAAAKRTARERPVSATQALRTHAPAAAKAAATPGSESAAAAAEGNFLASAALGGTGSSVSGAVSATGGAVRAAHNGLSPAQFAQAVASSRSVPDEIDNITYVPGLDERLLPVVRALAAEVQSKRGELGHLLWALGELLRRGGVIRYSLQPANNEPLASYEPETNAIHVHLDLSRVNPRLQAALLAARLQWAYDHLVGRYPGIRESMVRPMLALKAFMERTDMEALARSMDINNDVETQLFRDLRNELLDSADGFETLEWTYRGYPTASEAVASIEGQIEVEESDAAQVEKAVEQNAAAIAKLPDASGIKAELLRRRETLQIRSSARQAELLLLRARLDALTKDLGRETGGHYLGGALWLDPAHAKVAYEEKELPIVRSEAPEPVDGRLKPVLELLDRTIRSASTPEARSREYLLDALDRFRKLQGRIFFAPIQELAYVLPPLYHLVVDYTFVTLHPKLLVPILGHELAHVSDQIEGKALSMETEFHAFEVWADLAKEYRPDEIAEEVLARPDLYDRETNLKMLQVIYEIVEHRHDREGLLALVERRYGQLLGITYQGLLPAEDFKRKIARQMGDELRQLRDLELKESEAQAYHDGHTDRRWLADIQRQKSLRRAMVLLYQRQIEQMERAMAEYQPAS